MSIRSQLWKNRQTLREMDMHYNQVWHVASAVTTTGTGKSWESPFKTIAEAIAAASDGDIILMIGTFTEALTSAKQLSFVNAGLTVNDCIWMESAAGDTLLTLTGKKCLFDGIRFRIPTTEGIGIDMTNSDYTVIKNCHFQGRSGSYYGIYNSGGSQLKILNNVFQYLNTATYGAAILGHDYATVCPSGWIMKGNLFHSNLKHVQLVMRQSLIEGNTFQEKGLDADNVSSLTATHKLDLLTGSALGQLNTVTKNIMQGDYSITGGYKPAVNDNWFGNISDDTAEAEVNADGTTLAVPAA